jgi:hypothetical protein
MSMFREICTFISNQTGFVIGDTLQVGHRIQDAPDRCVLISERGGGEPNDYFVDMANLEIQIITRAKSYFDARDDAWTVYEAIQASAGWNMPRIDGSGEDFLAMTVNAISTPGYISTDENGRHEFSVNFIFRMEEASCGP